MQSRIDTGTLDVDAILQHWSSVTLRLANMSRKGPETDLFLADPVPSGEKEEMGQRL